MDADLARSAVDDAFEGLGTPGCRYEPPGGGVPVEGLVLILHRPSTGQAGKGVRFSAGQMSFETTAQTAAVVVRADDVDPLPVEAGVFVIGARRWTIGQDPVEDDAHGYTLRCAVTAERRGA